MFIPENVTEFQDPPPPQQISGECVVLLHGSDMHSKVPGKKWRLQTGHCTISKIWVPPCVGLQNHKVLTAENNSFFYLLWPSICTGRQALFLIFQGTLAKESSLNTHEESVFCVKLTGDITKGKFDQQFFLTLPISPVLIFSRCHNPSLMFPD